MLLDRYFDWQIQIITCSFPFIRLKLFRSTSDNPLWFIRSTISHNYFILLDSGQIYILTHPTYYLLVPFSIHRQAFIYARTDWFVYALTVSYTYTYLLISAFCDPVIRKYILLLKFSLRQLFNTFSMSAFRL